jgi:flagellar protein FlaG
MAVKPINDSNQIGAQVIASLQTREPRTQTNQAEPRTRASKAELRTQTSQAEARTGQSTTDATEEAKLMVERFNEALATQTNVHMYYDDDINEVIVTVVDAESEEVIRQIPPEDFITFAKRFDLSLGTLYDGRA